MLMNPVICFLMATASAKATVMAKATASAAKAESSGCGF